MPIIIFVSGTKTAAERSDNAAMLYIIGRWTSFGLYVLVHDDIFIHDTEL